MVRTMGDASGAMSVYTGPDVPTSVAQAIAAAAQASAAAGQAAYHATKAANASDIPTASDGARDGQTAASQALEAAAVAIAAANNAGLAMNAQATVIANSYSPVVPDNTVVNGTVTSTHTGGGH